MTENDKNLVTKIKFAQLAKVNSSTIITALKRDLKNALVGNKIDLNHEAAQTYLTKQRHIPKNALQNKILSSINENPVWSVSGLAAEFRVGQRKIKEAMEGLDGIPEPNTSGGKKLYGHDVLKEKKKKANNTNNNNEMPDDIREYADYTLAELIKQFGTDAMFVDWLNALQKIENIMTSRLKNAATKKELVSRKLIQVGVLDQIEACHNKLLTDGAKTIARRVIAMHDGGRRIEDCEVFASNQISSFIKPMKEKIAKALENA